MKIKRLFSLLLSIILVFVLWAPTASALDRIYAIIYIDGWWQDEIRFEHPGTGVYYEYEIPQYGDEYVIVGVDEIDVWSNGDYVLHIASYGHGMIGVEIEIHYYTVAPNPEPTPAPVEKPYKGPHTVFYYVYDYTSDANPPGKVISSGYYPMLENGTGYLDIWDDLEIAGTTNFIVDASGVDTQISGTRINTSSSAGVKDVSLDVYMVDEGVTSFDPYNSGYTGGGTYSGQDLVVYDYPSMSNLVKTRSYSRGYFSDVPASHWGYDTIVSSYEYGFMNGDSAGFHPEDSMTLAEALAIAARIHNIACGKTGQFAQSGSNWYDIYVNYCLQNSILDESAAPSKTRLNAPVSRDKFCDILYNACSGFLSGPNDSRAGLFSDYSSIENSYEVMVLAQYGIVGGSPPADEDGYLQFKPYNDITRAEAATIIARIVNPDLRLVTSW